LKDNRLYLNHILECAGKVNECVKEGREKFFENQLIQDAVLRNLQVMAESCQRLTQSLKDRHPEVDWRGLIGFRNLLVHDYFGVDLEIVWALINQKLSGLIQMARSELDQ
jgi:uncharacterized protein with HEPN domain